MSVLRVQKVELRLEALTGGVLKSAFNNFARFTVKRTCWSLFLIKLQAWLCATFQEKKLCPRGFVNLVSFCKFSQIFNKTYFVEHGRTDAWVKWTKKMFSQNLFTGKHRWWRPFNAIVDIWVYSFSKKWLHHRFFSTKIRKFYRTSILQNNAAWLLLISCDIFNVLLALPVINQFSHNMEIC